MTVPVHKVPPPPPIAVNDPVFNRWLHDLTAFLDANGNIDPGTIPGYGTLVSTVALHTTQIANHTTQISAMTSAIGANTSAIAALNSQVTTHTTEISDLYSTTATHTSQIAANTADIITNTADIVALQARGEVLIGAGVPADTLGKDSDWFANTNPPKGVYVKVSGAWLKVA